VSVAHKNTTGTATLALAALGVVYGDIGTSPLYAFKEAFGGPHAIPLSQDNVYAVLSLMFWAVTLIVSLKYVTFMLRFDHRGEGGVLALLTHAMHLTRERPAVLACVMALGMFAASLFYGDALITPAISVLSAVEGLSVATPRFEKWVAPIAIGLLVALFLFQRRGTARVGRVFGPVMVGWFLTLAALGIHSIVQSPGVLYAVNPVYALAFVRDYPGMALIVAGAVFLCVTGAEALYADMGHFGKVPIRVAWYMVAFPALMLNYFGQGALVLRNPEAAKNPFYLIAPDFLILPLVVLATCATIIASQATISAAYSVTQQASRLNFLPRLRVLHTSDTAQGQIYIPLVNWLMLIGVVGLVLGFGSSSALAGAYGIAVNGDMIIGTVILGVVVFKMGKKTRWPMLAVLALFFLVEALFLGANLTKLGDGGWFPLALGAAIFFVLKTWHRGVELIQARKGARPEGRVERVQTALSGAVKIPLTGIFFSASRTGYPSAFLHNLKHNMVVHERTIFMTVEFVDVPYVDDDERLDIEKLDDGFWRVIGVFGFRETPDIATILRLLGKRGLRIDVESASFFTSKAALVSVTKPRYFGVRRKLFAWMLQNSATVADYLRLPPHRVVELGTQVAV
jgi:KUP system potassium uptake protein